ncbi:hypothetical protein BD413DRAFT_195915 [Trametes elegans]|nr:hypothetical protein BD413DRAFT_195915 [Trametes elegans]
MESYLWALAYAVLRNLFHRKVGTLEEQERLQTIFANASGATSADTVFQRRSILPVADPLVRSCAKRHFSGPLSSVFRDYATVLHYQAWVGTIKPPSHLDPETAFSHKVFTHTLRMAFEEMRGRRDERADDPVALEVAPG